MLTLWRQCYKIMDRKARRQGAFIFFYVLTGAGLETFSIGLILPYLQLVGDPSLVSQTTYLSDLYGLAGDVTETGFVMLLGIVFFLIFLFKSGFMLSLVYIQNRFSYNNAVTLSHRLLRAYLKGPYTLHLGGNSADFIRTVDEMVIQFYANVIRGQIVALTELLVMAGIAVVLFLAEPFATLSAVGVLGLFIVSSYGSFRRRIAAWGQRNVKLRQEILKSLHHSLGSVKEIKILGRFDHFTESYRVLAANHGRIVQIYSTLSQAPRFFFETLMVGGMILVMVLILYEGNSVNEMMASLGLFAVAAFRLIPSMNRIIMALNDVRFGRAAVDRIESTHNLLSMPSEIDEAASPVDPLRFADRLELSDVTFRYPNSDHPALAHISLTIRSGEVVGFVGPSGSGKSTLIDVILGLLPPDSGRLSLDGQDILADPRPWQASIGYVPQAIYLTDDTLKHNVAFGIEDAEIDDERLWNALRLARLDDFVRSQSNGVDTTVGEVGTRLSGGQRQRIGIARALYHDPAVLVMDEATSALDTKTETEITGTIQGLRREKTVLIIAHRLSTVRNCDTLFLMEDGRITDEGDFQTLVRTSPKFRHLVELAETSTHEGSASVLA